jgi:hypothetical protein
MMPNSLKYIVFLALAAAGHAIAPKKWRNGLLLAVSWLFYLLSMPEYLPLLIAVTALTWLAGRQMERRPLHKRAILTVMLLGCFGLLFVYKYLAFALSLLGKHILIGVNDFGNNVFANKNSHILFCGVDFTENNVFVVIVSFNCCYDCSLNSFKEKFF